MIIYLVRHGQTAHNRDGLGLGRSDVPLTDLGELQAASVGGTLANEPIDRIYSSPLHRTAVTARAIAGERGVPVEFRDELLELDVGETEGLPIAEASKRYPDFLQRWMGPEGHRAVMPGGESLVDVAARVGPFVAELRQESHAGIAVVAHHFTLRAVFCELTGLDISAFRSVTFDLASLSVISLRGGRLSIWRLNDRCHLEGLNLDPQQRSV